MKGNEERKILKEQKHRIMQYKLVEAAASLKEPPKPKKKQPILATKQVKHSLPLPAENGVY